MATARNTAGSKAAQDDPVEKELKESLNAKSIQGEEPEWASGFEEEEFADIVQVWPKEKLVANFRTNNIVPGKDINGNPIEREVVEVEVLPGSTVTDREYPVKANGKTDYDAEPLSSKPVPVGEIRSFWASSEIMEKLFAEWDPREGENFAVYNGGKRDNKAGTSTYWDWKMAMDRPKATPTRNRRPRNKYTTTVEE